MPILKLSCLSPGRLAFVSAMAACASTAHCTAFTALPNSARTLSPAVLAMRPLWSAMALSRIARRSVSPVSVPTSSSAHQAAVALDVGREDSNQPALGINRFRQNTPLDPVGSLPLD